MAFLYSSAGGPEMTKFSYQIWVFDGAWKELSYSQTVYDTIAAARLAAMDAMVSSPSGLTSAGILTQIQWTVRNDLGARVDAGVKGGGTAPADSPAGGFTPAAPPTTGKFDPPTIVTGLVMISVTAAVLFVGYMCVRHVLARTADHD